MNHIKKLVFIEMGDNCFRGEKKVQAKKKNGN